MIKKTIFLGGSNSAIALFGLLRNIIIARLISVDDFGIASTFAISVALIEMMSNFSLDRMLVQAKDGNSKSFQANIQGLQFARGVLSALLLFFAAEPLARLFSVPDLVWAYQSLALVPLIRSLAHFDMVRIQRKMRFDVSIKVELGAIILSSGASIPLAVWLNDYTAMLYALMLQQLIFTILSHHLARRKYVLSFNWSTMLRIFYFGWPLLLNGILMFLILQGDRVLVGSLIGMTELGWYAAAVTLTLSPSNVIAKTLGTLFFPQLSGSQSKAKDFDLLYISATQASFASGALLASIIVLVGPWALSLLFGVRYEPAIPLLAFLGIMQGVRISKSGPALVSTAKADTKNPLYANIARALVLPVAWLMVENGAGVMTIIYLGILGELMALSVSLYLLQKKQKLSLRPIFLPLVISLLIYFALATTQLEIVERSTELRFLQGVVIASLLLILAWSVPELRNWGLKRK